VSLREGAVGLRVGGEGFDRCRDGAVLGRIELRSMAPYQVLEMSNTRRCVNDAAKWLKDKFNYGILMCLLLRECLDYFPAE
jgi:hypothetical protein